MVRILGPSVAQDGVSGVCTESIHVPSFIIVKINDLYRENTKNIRTGIHSYSRNIPICNTVVLPDDNQTSKIKNTPWGTVCTTGTKLYVKYFHTLPDDSQFINVIDWCRVYPGKTRTWYAYIKIIDFCKVG